MKRSPSYRALTYGTILNCTANRLINITRVSCSNCILVKPRELSPSQLRLPWILGRPTDLRPHFGHGNIRRIFWTSTHQPRYRQRTDELIDIPHLSNVAFSPLPDLRPARPCRDHIHITTYHYHDNQPGADHLDANPLTAQQPVHISPTSTTSHPQPSKMQPTARALSYFRITLHRSSIGLPERTRGVLKSLGLRKRSQTVFHPVHPQFAGMIMKVKELVRVEEVERAMTKKEVKAERTPEAGFYVEKAAETGRVGL